MKKYVLVVLIVVVTGVGSIAYAQDENARILQSATSDYLSGDWLAAATAFEALVERGVTEPTVYLNLGHAYAQQGRLGSALLNYRRAEQMIPRDPEVLGYIASIIAARRDQSAPVDSWLKQLYRLTADLVTTNELGTTTLLIWNLLFLVVAGAQSTWPDDHLKSSLRLAVLPLGAVVVLLLLLFGVRVYVDSALPNAVVIVEQSTLRSGPAST